MTEQPEKKRLDLGDVPEFVKDLDGKVGRMIQMFSTILNAIEHNGVVLPAELRKEMEVDIGNNVEQLWSDVFDVRQQLGDSLVTGQQKREAWVKSKERLLEKLSLEPNVDRDALEDELSGTIFQKAIVLAEKDRNTQILTDLRNLSRKIDSARSYLLLILGNKPS